MELKSEIRAANESKKLVVGMNNVLKEIRKKKVKKIILAKNTPEEVKERMFFYSELNKIPVDVFSEDNVQMGILCKRSFMIAVLGIKK